MLYLAVKFQQFCFCSFKVIAETEFVTDGQIVQAPLGPLKEKAYFRAGTFIRVYSRTSMARTLVARLPWLFRTRS